MKLKFTLLASSLVLLAIADIRWGATNISNKDFINYILGNASPQVSLILGQIRIPQMFTALIAGSGLALSGLFMQTLFRNPLAGPFVLGINSGASFGVSILLLGSVFLPVGIQNFMSNDLGISLSALLGALGILFLMFWAAGRVGGNFTILILGLIIGQILGAMQSALTFLSDAESLKIFSLWGMGNFSQTDSQQVIILGMILMGTLAVGFRFSNKMDVYLLGDKYAVSENLNLNKFRRIMIVLSGVIAGIVTAYCGPIAFIGMSVPHLARHLFGTFSHQKLIPACVLLGALLSVLCDLLSQTLINHQIIPINILTAIIGGPIVIWVIVKQRRGHEI